MDTTEELNGYFFAGMDNLSPQELFFWVFLEEAQKQLGTEDIVSLALIILGYPLLPTRGKFAGATQGTSVLSLTMRQFKRHKFEAPKLTLTLESIKHLRFAYTKNLSAFVGRWVPFLGVIILLYNSVIIMKNTLSHYNMMVKPEHRLYD